MQEPSLSHNLFLFGCLLGTLSPSRRQNRSTFLWLTCQPSIFKRAVIRLYPYLPYWHASSVILEVNLRPLSWATSWYRCVDLGCPIALHILRSETFLNFSCIHSIARRLLAGLRSFPRLPPLGWPYPGRGPRPASLAGCSPAQALLIF